jgi:hypothetical protein
MNEHPGHFLFEASEARCSVHPAPAVVKDWIGCIDCSAKTFHLAQAANVPCETLPHKAFVLITSQLANFSYDGVRLPRVTEA